MAVVTPLLRAVVALLDLAITDVQWRCRAWRCLDALRLSGEDLALVARELDVSNTGDDRRENEFSAWAKSLTLAKYLGSDESTSPTPSSGPPSRGKLRLVGSSEPSTTKGERT